MPTIRIAINLVYIYYRKMFVKGDLLAVGLLLTGFAVSLVAIYRHYADFYQVLFLFLTATFSHHSSRKDFSLLKMYCSLKKTLILEYIAENLPILLLFLLKKDVVSFAIYFILLVMIAFLPQKSSKIKYPFHIFDPFWHISFRKYKLIVFFPVILFLIIVGKYYNNKNLALFSLFLMTFIGVLPYFQREYLLHINQSVYVGADYLFKQIKIGFLNFITLFTPVFIVFLICFQGAYFWVYPLFFVVLLFGILTKYAFFDSILSQNIIFLFIIAGFQYGISIIMLPFLYYLALKRIKKIQYVTN